MVRLESYLWHQICFQKVFFLMLNSMVHIEYITEDRNFFFPMSVSDGQEQS